MFGLSFLFGAALLALPLAGPCDNFSKKK